MEDYMFTLAFFPRSLPLTLEMTWATMMTLHEIWMPIWQKLTWRAFAPLTFTPFLQLYQSCAQTLSNILRYIIYICIFNSKLNLKTKRINIHPHKPIQISIINLNRNLICNLERTQLEN